MAAPPTGEAIRLDIAEARRLAVLLLNDGQSADAATIAEGLLRRDPDDFDARLILAQAQLRLGQLDAAARSGRRAYAVATSDPARYQAAHTTAAALNLSGSHTTSQLWLRRAAQYAPDETGRKRVAQDFRSVAAANPLQMRLNFGARPSSNINNGSLHDIEELGGLVRVLTGAEKALPGLEFSADARLRYRLSETDRRRLWVGFDARTLAYRLSERAREIAPTARGRDFSYMNIALSAGLDLRDATGRGETVIAFEVDQSWSSATRTTHSAGLSVKRQVRVGKTSTLGFGASATQRWRKDKSSEDTTILGVSGQWRTRLASGAEIGFDLGYSDSDSDSWRVANRSVQAGVNFAFAKPVLGADLDIWARVQSRKFDLPFIVFDPREDTRISVGATLFFRDLDYYGFAPTLDLGYSRNRSNIGGYDGRSLGLGLGVRSVF